MKRNTMACCNKSSQFLMEKKPDIAYRAIKVDDLILEDENLEFRQQWMILHWFFPPIYSSKIDKTLACRHQNFQDPRTGSMLMVAAKLAESWNLKPLVVWDCHRKIQWEEAQGWTSSSTEHVMSSSSSHSQHPKLGGRSKATQFQQVVHLIMALCA